MRTLALLWVLGVVPVMAQLGALTNEARSPNSSVPVVLQGAEGSVFVPTASLHRLAVAEPDIATPAGAPPEGVVSLQVTVAKSGAVVEAVARQGDEVLSKAAADGVMTGWKYRPLLVNGEPQEFQSMILVDFRDGVGKRAIVAGMGAMGGIAGRGFGAGVGSLGAVRVSGGVAAGMMQQSVAPIYPPIARAAHVQGAVIMQALISKAGDVENLQVISGPPMLIAAAQDAVRQWKYRPYLLNGEPTAVETTINVNFTMAEPTKPNASDSPEH